MELFLNFVWVLIAVFGLSVWRVCWAPGRLGRRQPLREWTAIVAALVFLFFAVSLTDDLHSGLVLFEESANGRRQSVVLASAHASPQDAKNTSAAAGAWLGHFAWVPQVHCVGIIEPFQQDSPAFLTSDLLPGRGPPSHFL
jgi:cytochrome b561